MGKGKHLLAVVRWPVGGIRTYMRYVYAHLGADYRVTILAANVQESAALREDAEALGAELILAPASALGFFRTIFRTLGQGRHDLIQSQGFISAIAACLANIPFRKPHVLTVHGVLEDRLLQGVKGRLKRLVTTWAIRSVDVVYAVSQDILAHVLEQVPGLSSSRVRQVAILNGIEPRLFLESGQKGAFRHRHALGEDLFLFGFLGRFMPQKGFDKIVEALAILERENESRDYRLVAVGSGDYRVQYEKLARDKGIGHRIVFLPFQRDVAEVYRDLNAVVMPSNWEACPLQPMEALASGVPIITSDCIGLREVVRETPAVVVPGGEPGALARAMAALMRDGRGNVFREFQSEAAVRFDVRNTALEVRKLLDSLCKDVSP